MRAKLPEPLLRLFVEFDDPVTIARLIELADICHANPQTLIAAIVRDVLEDDALAHMPDPHLTLH
jgi:hypothetical protein